MNWFMSSRSFIDLLFLVFLMLTLRYFWKERSFLCQTQHWLKTKGHMIQFKLTNKENRYWPKIAYTYQVFGKTFTGHALFLDTTHNSPASRYSRRVAYQAALAYERNTEIEIYYNPNDPGQCVLDITIPRKLNAIIATLILIICVQLGFIFARFL